MFSEDSGGGSKKEKKTKRARKNPVSSTKRLGREAGDLVRDADFQLWKCPESYPNYILYCHNMIHLLPLHLLR